VLDVSIPLILRVCTTCESRFLLWNSRGLPDPNSRAYFCDDDEACNCNYFHSHVSQVSAFARTNRTAESRNKRSVCSTKLSNAFTRHSRNVSRTERERRSDMAGRSKTRRVAATVPLILAAPNSPTSPSGGRG
jgi:hypothetical protein